MGPDNPTMNRDAASSGSSIAVDLNYEPKSPFPTDVVHIQEVPSIPDDLTPGQRAQVCEILDYLQSRLHRLIESARIDENSQEVTLKFSAWQRLLDAQARLALMTRQIADPDWPAR